MKQTAKEQVRAKIAELVERFSKNLESYKQTGYKEAQLRQDYINPFFKALGWDVDNEAGQPEPYRDVITEAALTIDAAVKAPDYLFTIYGHKKFFVEAKKPSIFIKEEIAPAYQIRLYGWNAKFPMSLITDFEEFAIYDCTKKPKLGDKTSVCRLDYLVFSQYLERFDFLYDIFAKENVLQGSLERYFKTDGLKRGTESVDKDFLASMEEWRKQLAGNIAVRNAGLTEEQINYTVQQTLDRILFLRICEDRGVEHYGNLRDLLPSKSKDAGDYYESLYGYFQKADQKYNSGLFDFKKDTLSKGLAIDNKVLQGIISNLYFPKCSYLFSEIPVEILGNTYEQFLGSVIRLTAGHHVKIEQKPEVRKAGGVYYTPQYIVNYIVQNTVGKLVEGKTPEAVSTLKIVDPACGSGSFLLGAYQFLLDWHLHGYVKSGRKTGKASPLTPEGRLTTAEKKRILLNNIHGVDIDSQAVEVTKLSLLLKCLEGETRASVESQLSLYHDRVLPTLDNNIKCGNSLIAPDVNNGFLAMDKDVEKKVRPFDWKSAFPEIFRQGGFDAVIGNPPYVRQELLGDSKPYFETHYKVYNGTADLYSYFFERGITLLNDKGVFGIIVANKWMRANYGEPLRKWLKEQDIAEIIDFGDLPVFESATTYPCIFISRKAAKGKGAFDVTNVKTLDFTSLQEYVNANRIKVGRESLEDAGWNLASQDEQRLLQKIKTAGIPLGEYVQGKIYRGVLTGLNEAFVIDAATRKKLIAEDKKCAEIIKPFLAGRDIKRYQTPVSDKHLIFTRRGIDIDKYPSIKKHLLQYKEQLMPKPANHKGKEWKGRKPGRYEWYEIQDSVDYYKEFEKPKILWPGISGEVTAFAFDANGYYGNDNNQLIVSDDLYLLGILNSKLTYLLMTNICDKVQGGFYRLKIVYIENLPVKVIEKNNQRDVLKKDSIIDNVKTIINLNQRLKASKTPSELEQIQNRITYSDNKINELVYCLYGLTEAEVRIVEGAGE
ncbi:MAG: TaqI-like C-terminal specificity domain-containing protein [Fibrobacterota bacterium]